MSGLLAGTFGKVVVVALILLAAAALTLTAVKTFKGMLDDAERQGKALSDAEYQAMIAKSNTEVAKRDAAQARMIVQVQADASDKIAAIEREQTEKVKDNALLPNGDKCGVDAAHGRLLIR
jgi:predicted small secreted protein